MAGGNRARTTSIIVPQGAQGPQGYQGADGAAGVQGPQGAQGEDGSGFFSFEIDSNGDLLLYYADGQDPPPLSIDSNGDLIYTY